MGPAASGPMAKGPGLLARGHVGCGCRRHPRYEPTSIFEIVPCQLHQGYLSEEAKTSARRRFLGSSRTSRYLPIRDGGAGVKYNSSRAVINGLSADGVGDHDSN